MFKRVLIAKGGEVACLVIATAKKTIIQTVAFISDADSDSRNLMLTDKRVEKSLRKQGNIHYD